MSPCVSVIVPVWNSDQWLAECMDSICEQLLHDIEIICINDASSDNSGIILQRYAKKDSRINVINLSRNVGEGAARNIGLEIVSGEYVGFVDSDDSVTPYFFKKLYDDAIRFDADISRGYIREYGFGNTIEEKKDMLALIKKNKAYFLSGFSTAIYRMSFLKSWNIKFEPYVSRGADVSFLLRSVAACSSITVNNEAIYNYIRRENRADSIELSLKKITDTFKTYSTVLSFLYKNHFDSYICDLQLAYMISACISSARRAFKNDRSASARLCAAKLIDMYNMCDDRDRFYKFINKEKSIYSEIVNGVLQALSASDVRKIEFYILSSYFQNGMQNVRQRLGKNIRDDI